MSETQETTIEIKDEKTNTIPEDNQQNEICYGLIDKKASIWANIIRVTLGMLFLPCILVSLLIEYLNKALKKVSIKCYQPLCKWLNNKLEKVTSKIQQCCTNCWKAIFKLKCCKKSKDCLKKCCDSIQNLVSSILKAIYGCFKSVFRCMNDSCLEPILKLFQKICRGIGNCLNKIIKDCFKPLFTPLLSCLRDICKQCAKTLDKICCQPIFKCCKAIGRCLKSIYQGISNCFKDIFRSSRQNQSTEP